VGLDLAVWVVLGGWVDMCVCMCVCVGAWFCVCVCVCVFAFVDACVTSRLMPICVILGVAPFINDVSI
jgi:hypothetical protein